MRRLAAALALVPLLSSGAPAQRRQADADRFDPIFRKYTKRFFGPGFDWRLFKAQGLAESGLDPAARSHVGARGVMQLMPSTFKLIRSARPEMSSIDDPEWNIAAGIMHDRYLWRLWSDSTPSIECHRFMFGSYNAGEGTIMRARAVAKAQRLDAGAWPNIASIAPQVQRWRYRETLGYVRKIDESVERMTKRR